jgi:hypothetical protein
MCKCIGGSRSWQTRWKRPDCANPVLKAQGKWMDGGSEMKHSHISVMELRNPSFPHLHLPLPDMYHNLRWGYRARAQLEVVANNHGSQV